MIGAGFGFAMITGMMGIESRANCDSTDGSAMIRNGIEVPHVAPPRIDRVGFFYAFAAMEIIQQHYCAQLANSGKKKCDFNHIRSEDFLSIADVVAQYNEAFHPTRDGGSGFQALTAIAQSSRIAKDSCAPFEIIFNTAQLQSYPNQTLTTNEVLKIVFENYRKSVTYIGETYLPSEQVFRSCENRALPDFSEILRVSKRAMPLSTAIEKFVFPEACKSKRVSISPFEVVQAKIQDPAQFEKKLGQILQRLQRPVQIDICLREEAKSLRECANHVTVVTGYRERCCSEGCQGEFKLADSMNLVWAKTKTRDRWVSAQEIFSRNRLFQNRPNLTWIVPATASPLTKRSATGAPSEASAIRVPASRL